MDREPAMAYVAAGSNGARTGPPVRPYMGNDLLIETEAAAGTRPRRRADQAAPDLALIYPVFDTRGAEAGRILSWARDQTLARDHYQLLVVVDSAARGEAIAPLLAPHDELVVAQGANDVAMWNAAALRAGAPWVVMTEGHCIAEPGCLQSVARWIASDPDAAAGNFAVGHLDGDDMAELSGLWFADVHARWRGADEWDRLHRAGCVVRADTFRSIGGFVPYAGQFSVPLLSALLADHGHAIVDVPGAGVIHVDSATMRDHHIDTVDHVRGECEARARFDPAFFERYFGHDPLFADRLGTRRGVAQRMLIAVIAAMLAAPRALPRLAAMVPPLAAAASIGAGPGVAVARLAVRIDEFVLDRRVIPGRRRLRRYVRAHARVVDLARRVWALGHNRPAGPPVAWRHRDAAEITPDMLTGVHGLERADQQWFRWSRPVCMFRLAADSRPRVLRIDTGALRGDPLQSVIAVMVDRRLLAPGSVTGDGHGILDIPLPAARRAARASEVTIISDPLRPGRHGGADTRSLGLPIVSCTLAPRPH